VNNQISIIIVDDNEIDLLIAKRLLSRVNPYIKVETFASGLELSSWMRTRTSDDYLETTIFLIDIYMPQSNGYNVAQEVQEIFAIYSNQAICYMLSATIDFLERAKVENDSNVTGFIGKPITVATYNSILSKFS
jgi:CheY-like chemotaxis protein